MVLLQILLIAAFPLGLMLDGVKPLYPFLHTGQFSSGDTSSILKLGVEEDEDDEEDDEEDDFDDSTDSSV